MKHWFLPAILILGLGMNACSSDIEDEIIIPDPPSTNSRVNTNVSLSSNAAPSSFSTKILIEDYTGTWCGWCPGLAHNLEKVIKADDNIIGIGIHVSDDMESTYAESLTKTFKITDYPTAILNRSVSWEQAFRELEDPLSETANIGLAIQTTIENEIVKGTVQIGFNADISKSIDYVIYLVEDKVQKDQANYYNELEGYEDHPLYGIGDPIKDFKHANVLRKIATDIYGDIIPEDYTKKGKICEAKFEMNLGDYNKENCYILAFVVEKGGKNILNAQIVKTGSDKDFD